MRSSYTNERGIEKLLRMIDHVPLSAVQLSAAFYILYLPSCSYLRLQHEMHRKRLEVTADGQDPKVCAINGQTMEN